MIYHSGFNTAKSFTSNQPLLLGGQLYMWNRWLNCAARSHGVNDQYTKGPQSRCIVFTPERGEHLITAPISKVKGDRCSDVFIVDPERWANSTSKTFDSMYGRYAYYRRVKEDFKNQLFLCRAGSLATFNLSFFVWLAYQLGYPAVGGEIPDEALYVRSPDMTASAYVAALTLNARAHVYLGGGDAHKAYIDDKDFRDRGVEAVDQNYDVKLHDTEGHVDGSISVLHPLFIAGPEVVRDLCLTDPLCTQVQKDLYRVR